PKAMDEARRIYGERPDFVLCDSPEAAVEGADALVICTEWKQFRVVDFGWLKQTLARPFVIDGRNLYDPAEVQKHGLVYSAIGRGVALGSVAPPNG
ncbi:UDP binding domain-containing protein, partial [Aquamicrobium soli]